MFWGAMVSFLYVKVIFSIVTLHCQAPLRDATDGSPARDQNKPVVMVMMMRSWRKVVTLFDWSVSQLSRFRDV